MILTIPGQPITKGRPRFSVIRNQPHVYTDAKTLAAEQAMVWHLRSAHVGPVDDESWFAVEATFYVPKLTRSTRRGDGDNFLKLVCDAATGIVWKDDSQVLDWIAHVRAGQPRTVIEIVVIEEPEVAA